MKRLADLNWDLGEKLQRCDDCSFLHCESEFKMLWVAASFLNKVQQLPPQEQGVMTTKGENYSQVLTGISHRYFGLGLTIVLWFVKAHSAPAGSSE